MKKSRSTEEQIAFALRQAEGGTPIEEVCRKMGISEQTFFRWKKKFAGMGIAEVRRLKQLEEEKRKLKALVADLSLDKAVLRGRIREIAGVSAGCRRGSGSTTGASSPAGCSISGRT